MDELGPEEFEISLGWLALCGKSPSRDSVGSARTLEDSGMDSAAIAGGNVT